MAGRSRKTPVEAGNGGNGAGEPNAEVGEVGAGNGAGATTGGVDGGNGGAQENRPAPEAVEAVAEEAPRKKRGRPPGSGKPKAPEGTEAEARTPVKLDARQVAAQLQGMHAFAAAMAREPLLQLGDAQAAMLGSAVAEASKYYNFAPDGKIMALVSLAGAAMIVYVPMFAAINIKRRMQRAEQAQTVPPAPEADMTAQPSSGVYRFE